MSAQREDNTPVRSLPAKAVSGGFWQLAAVTTHAVLQLLVMGVLSRLLVPTDFGLAAVAAVVAGSGAMLSDMGMAAAIVQRAKLADGDIKLAFVTTVALGAFFAVIVYLGREIVQEFVAIEGVSAVVGVAAISFLFTAVGAVSRALLQRNLLFKKLFALDIVSFSIAYLGCGLPLAASGYGVWSLIGAALVHALVQSIMAIRMRPIPLRGEISFVAMKGMLSFGGGLTLTRIFNYIGMSGDQIVVGRMLGPSVLGTYERVMRIVSLPGLYLGNVLENVLFPVMARVQEDPRRFAEGFYKSISIVWFLLLPSSVLLCYLAPQIVHVLLGPGWPAAVAPLQILFLMVPFRSSVRIMDSLVRAKGAVYRSALRRIVFAAAVVSCVFLGSNYGIVGVAVGVGLSNVFLFVLMLHLCFAVASIASLPLLRAMVPGMVLAALVLVIIALLDVMQTFMPMGDIALVLSSFLTCVVAGILMIRVFPGIVGPHIETFVKLVILHWSRKGPDQRVLFKRGGPESEEGTTSVFDTQVQEKNSVSSVHPQKL